MHIGGHLSLVDETLLETGAHPVRQQVREHIGRFEARIVERRRMKHQVDPRHLHAILDVLPTLPPLQRIRHAHGLPGRAARDVPKPVLDPRERPGGLHVAGDDEHRVVGAVITIEEVVHVLQGGAVQVLHVADRRVAVRVALGIRDVEQRLESQSVRPILVRLPPLVLHHLPLVVQLLLGDSGLEEAHPV